MKKWAPILVSLSMIGEVPAKTIPQAFVFFNGGNATIKGFAQTPKGGSVGTTYFNRPSFTEVNLVKDAITQLGIGIKLNKQTLLIDYYKLHLHGDNSLTNDLLTHARFIPQGQPLSINLKYDWYRLGIGHDFLIHPWTVMPFLRGNLINYSYQFNAPAAHSKRAFDLGGVTAGINSAYALTTHWQIALQGEMSIPFSRLKIYQGSIGLNYQGKLSTSISYVPQLALSTFRIDYLDKQLVPNHIRYHAQPYINAGLLLQWHPARIK